jgi:glutaminyl-peptide cyclotransferase
VVAAVAALFALLVAGTVACGGDTAGTAAPAGGAVADGGSWGPCRGGSPAEPAQLLPEVVDEVPHDPEAFTQGLVVLDGEVWESTGLEGRSTVRRVDLPTGEVLDSAALADDQFGEGLASRGDDELVQLTWTDGTALRWERDGLEPVGSFAYRGEGWGLAAVGGGTLAMSDGSDTVTLRSAGDFSVTATVRVRRAGGGGTDGLNELEHDGTHLFANRWRTDEVVRIDGCGHVDAVVDVSALRQRAEAVAEAQGTGAIDVPNGIAALGPGEGTGSGDGRFLLTGKLWPVMFEVRLVAAPG